MTFKKSTLTNIKFDTLALHPQLSTALEDAGFVFQTKIQEKGLPFILEGKDVIGQSQTGTGKTLAFLLGIAEGLLKNPDPSPMPGALILAPTRELVVQIATEARLICKNSSIVVTPVYGGEDYARQRHNLTKNCDIIVASPGRLIDYLKSKVFSLRRVKYFVVDEADRMFDMGFIPDVRYITRKLPPIEKRQSFLFSATINYRVLSLSYDLLKDNPEEISMEDEEIIVDKLNHFMYNVSQVEKLPLLLGLFKKDPSFKRVLIFCNTRDSCNRLSQKLMGNNIHALSLQGDLAQKKRFSILKKFKEAEKMALVATDVASRGLHIEDISHVINFDLPQNPLDYVHRIGRTARAGKSGLGISLVGERDAYYLAPIEKYLGKEVSLESFDPELLTEDESKDSFVDFSRRRHSGRAPGKSRSHIKGSGRKGPRRRPGR
ncbi:DEAD/DEAH box helicase [Candidatus Riflebacteria bacterium]